MKKIVYISSVMLAVIILLLLFIMPARKKSEEARFFPTITMGEFVKSVPAEISGTWHIVTIKIDEKEVQAYIPITMLESWMPGDSVFILEDNIVKHIDFIIPQEKAEELIAQGKARY